MPVKSRCRYAIRTKALYFPYINLPDDEWLYLMLLYWDQLSSIVPSEYLYNPESLSPHMSTLMREGLVNPLRPQEFIDDKEEFGKPFLDFVRHRVRARRTQLRDGAAAQRIPIHVEKLGQVADELVELNLATYTGYPWYEMDIWVANAFMSYLACLIGNLPEVNSAPITNNASCFQQLAGYSGRSFAERIRQREVALGEIFPFPKADLSLNKVIKFKEKYGDELARFRDHIEGLCIDLSNIPDPDDREEKRQVTMRELKPEIDLIAGRIQDTWQQVVFLNILPVLGVSGSVILNLQGDQTIAAGLGALSLPAAIYRYFERKRDRELLLNHPLAYGALLHRQWPRLRETNRR